MAYFINSSTGWVAGNKLLKTTNGGGLLTNVNNTSENIPSEFSLYQNYPNPFNPTTKIKFDIQKTSFTKLSVYNSEGKIIETLYNGNLNAGSYEINFDRSNYPSGIYFYKLETSEYIFSKKMLLLK
ncbi:MAG: T9SS type A sorting domain-containing protein [Ignavibacteria bacterium]|nr:T9SS type A sorting domain-containing protein [Ignavibacteria bacterium]